MKNRTNKPLGKKAKRQAVKKVKRSEKSKVEPKAIPGETDAKELNEMHYALKREFAEFAATAVAAAIQIGEKLQIIKKAVGHNYWIPWAEKHLKFDIRTANRYMALAKAKTKKTAMSDLKSCSSLMAAYALTGIIAKESAGKKVPFKLFSPAAGNVLNLPIGEISEADKETIRNDYERLEPIALQLYDQPSIFAVTWQKKLQGVPSRWTRKDVQVFKQEIQKAAQILAKVEEENLFDDKPGTATKPQAEKPSVIEGDAP